MRSRRPGPWLTPSSRIRCVRLHAELSARVCIIRQAAAATGRTLQTARGQGTLFPSCDHCAQGLEVRLGTAGGERLTWRGAGPGGRFDAGHRSTTGQLMARQRLAAVGLLDDVPTCDGLTSSDAARPR